MQNAVYRGVDGHLHGLSWSTGNVGADDLTEEAHAPPPAGEPAGCFGAATGTHHVVYRSGDGHVRHLSWTTGVVRHDDLTLLTGSPLAAGDPTAYVAPDGDLHAIYRTEDGHLYELIVSRG